MIDVLKALEARGIRAADKIEVRGGVTRISWICWDRLGVLFLLPDHVVADIEDEVWYMWQEYRVGQGDAALTCVRWFDYNLDKTADCVSEFLNE